MWRVLALIGGGVFLATAQPSAAVSERAVTSFVSLSVQFDRQLPRSTLSGLTDRQLRQRAQCILDRFEGRFGQQGVARLMDLMRVLARGAEFDDPTIVSFNERYGRAYNGTVSECTRSARSS